MTFEEYRQLRAYSWYDGIYLAILWIASFACLGGIAIFPPLSIISVLIALSTPFFVAYRLRLFREEGLKGNISFLRAFVYCIRVFLNAALLFAIAQWAYMQFIDNGRFASFIQTSVASPEMQEAMTKAGYPQELLQEAVKVFQNITPIEFATTYFIENCMIGIGLSFIIAFIMKKDRSSYSNAQL